MFRKLMMTFALALPAVASAQEATYQDTETKAVRGPVEQYTASNGWVFRVGDSVKLGTSTQTWHQNAGVQVFPLNGRGHGAEVSVKKLVVQCVATTKKQRCPVYMTTTAPAGVVYHITTFDLEGTIASSEVFPMGAVVQADRDAALEELKKAKDMLDLGLITQEDFDAKKAELGPIITRDLAKGAAPD